MPIPSVRKCSPSATFARLYPCHNRVSRDLIRANWDLGNSKLCRQKNEKAIWGRLLVRKVRMEKLSSGPFGESS